jgi:hypothetical protein
LVQIDLPQPKFLLFESLPQTMQPFEFVIFVVKGYREFVSYSEFPWQITSGFPVRTKPPGGGRYA